MNRRLFLATAALPLTAKSSLKFREMPGRVAVTLDGRVVTNFHFDEKWDKPFLFPLTTPSGLGISRGWPVEPKPGDTNDHEWHRGIFYGHGIVNGQDFWREQGRQKTSRLILQGKPRRSKGGFGGRFAMQPPNGAALGHIDQDFTLDIAGQAFRLGATIRIHADGGTDLKFGDTDDGGFAIRLSDHFRQERGAVLRNSEGLEKTEKIWGKNARWVHYAANVDGKQAGAVMFDHPSNVRYPTGWHARGYSLNSANPFATRSFTKDKTKDGSYVLKAGDTLALRYTVLLHDGAMTPEQIEKAAPR